jgi:hypothetical protein
MDAACVVDQMHVLKEGQDPQTRALFCTEGVCLSTILKRRPEAPGAQTLIWQSMSSERGEPTVKATDSARIRELLRLIAVIIQRMLDKKGVDAAAAETPR